MIIMIRKKHRSSRIFGICNDKKVGDKKKDFQKYTALPEQDKKKIQETLNDYIASTPDKNSERTLKHI